MKKTIKQLLQALSSSITEVPFEVRFWDGDTSHYNNGKPAFTLGFKNEQAARHILKSGSLGFGEEYMMGNVTVEGDFLKLMLLGTGHHFQNLKLSPKTKLSVILRYLSSLNTSKGSPKNVSHHYDRGNDFYRLFLDKSMTYSCAYFRKESDTLEQAQQQKYEHICRKLHLKKGETLVDIGCGWGGMLIYAAKNYGIKGVGCTLSKEQYKYAVERIKNEKLENNITIRLEDYRKITGPFDKFVSIGMFEHVGKKFIPVFMEKAHELLKPGGIGLLHTIGKKEYSLSDPFTMKYIFPGGYIPVLEEIVSAMSRTGLAPTDIENLRLHYALTLEEWHRRFEANVDKVEKMFDARFVRMWRMFLCSSAAAFRSGLIQLYHFAFTNGWNNSLPLTREHFYSADEKTETPQEAYNGALA